MLKATMSLYIYAFSFRCGFFKYCYSVYKTGRCQRRMTAPGGMHMTTDSYINGSLKVNGHDISLQCQYKYNSNVKSRHDPLQYLIHMFSLTVSVAF